MTDDNQHLHKRIQELEAAAIEQARVEHLIQYAAAGQDLGRYMALGVLYVDPSTRQIVDTNDATIELLGYTRVELLNRTLDDLEIAVNAASTQDGIHSRMYTATYQHRGGYPLTISVHGWLLKRNDRELMYYRLADDSLHRRVWYELQRREDEGSSFQQKLTTLNEITVELSKIESFDTLCFHVIKLGIERLGFDRMGLWLVDTENQLMRGTYGMDEAGNMRPEHGQSWSYVGQQVYAFISGKSDKPLIFDDSPLYNDKSQIIHYGWQVTVPVLHGQHCLGTLVADNYRHNRPIRNFEPELLRLYGITVAHLMELSRSREQATALHVANQLAYMLTEFITNIGHDFRTPLATINTNAYLMQRSNDGERRQKLATGIQAQVKHITTMVDRTLEFVAFQRNPMLTRTTVDLANLLQGVLHKHQSEITAKNILVNFTVDPTLSLQADNAYLSHAVNELMDNAVRYTGERGQIDVEGMSGSHSVTIRMRDTGVGMDADTLKRIFDPLYRGDEARTKRHSGLGLAIAQAIAAAHGGRIRVESTVGSGSLFEFIIPLDGHTQA
ncbi:MAG: GAF domain-containing protein [Chloroflexi bacterium]|nr:GAF domain-containing protein [Chloroflexota bacterium]MCC6893317.1 PAS domain-containing sensor histidine kinase [Anaerolineae bacterium]